MKEFIEKLIGRLEEETYDMEICEEQFDMNSPYFMDVEYKMVKIDDAKEIVNQLAKEHKDNVIIDGQYCWQTCGATEHCKECNRLCNGIIDYYENYDFMAEEYNGGWISVEERLPEDRQNVLITDSNGKVRQIVFNQFLFENPQYSHNIVPIAWQPLPDPHKESERVDRNIPIKNPKS